MSASVVGVVTWHPLADGCAPEWASGWGQDAHGPFVEFCVEGVTQPLRWIPPGRFLMGSPADEPGRFEDRESPQHWVTISQGFWLFDTPCSQKVWEAVMGSNPSQLSVQAQLVTVLLGSVGVGAGWTCDPSAQLSRNA